MECDPASTSVAIQFFPKSKSVHYYALTKELLEKSVVWKRLYKTIYQGSQENVVILNVQTKVLGNIKFCCPIISPFVSYYNFL